MSRGGVGKARWAKPAEIIEAVPSETATVTFPDGRTFQDADRTMSAEDIERMRTGRMCFNCMEPLETPWPEKCEALKVNGIPIGCGYAVKAQQARDFAAAFLDNGIRTIDKNKRINEEIERMRELDDYETRTGVVLPASVKFPTETVRRER